MFDISLFKEKLKTQWLGYPFLYLEKIDSTNTHLKKIPSEKLVHGIVLLADRQERGRGQHQRKWISEPGQNLTLTIGLKPRSSRALSIVTLATAWGVARALQNYSGIPFHLKWPNDVVIGGRKVAGILTEAVFSGSVLERLLVGIGLNVNQQQFPEDLGQATSLAVELGRTAVREELLCHILEQIEGAYSRWEEQDPGLLRDINHSLTGYGQWVNISVNGQLDREKVKFLGVNERGYLIVLTPGLEVRTFTYEQIRIHPDCEHTG